jgi:predicted CopG family antitoxin
MPEKTNTGKEVKTKQIKIPSELWHKLHTEKKNKSFAEYINLLLRKQTPEIDQLIVDLKKLFFEHSEILKPVYRNDAAFVNAILKDISIWEEGITETEQHFKLKIIEK